MVTVMTLKTAFAGTILTFLLMGTATAQVESAPGSLTGSWEGTLVIGRDSFELIFNLTQQEDSFSAALISRELGIYGMPAESVKLTNNRLTIRLDLLGAEYTGRLRLDESGSNVSFIDGEWFQEGEMVPVILRPSEN